MTYREAEEYILEIPKFTKKNDAVHTKTFLKYLGNPQANIKEVGLASQSNRQEQIPHDRRYKAGGLVHDFIFEEVVVPLHFGATAQLLQKRNKEMSEYFCQQNGYDKNNDKPNDARPPLHRGWPPVEL